nr:unnamed protein product [Callosobruchus chinensis]
MQNLYMAEPTEETWAKSAERFKNDWRFPNCVGSIDGKHVTIKCPSKSGSNYYCYLKKFSVVLMAIVGADYKFICVGIGGYGKNSDSGIFEASNMGRRFENGKMTLSDETVSLSPIVENAFGILAQKWRIFFRPMEVSVKSVTLIVKTCCILHNFLRDNNMDKDYIELLEPPEPRMEAFENMIPNTRRATDTAFDIRQKFVNHFNN